MYDLLPILNSDSEAQGRTLLAGALVFHAACWRLNAQLCVIVSFLNKGACQKLFFGSHETTNSCSVW